MDNYIAYLNELLVTCPDEAEWINLAISLTEQAKFVELEQTFSQYQASTPCQTNLLACVDNILRNQP